MKITKKYLKDEKLLEKVLEAIADYPAYCNRSNLSRGEIYAIHYVLSRGLDNSTPFEIGVKIKNERK